MSHEAYNPYRTDPTADDRRELRKNEAPRYKDIKPLNFISRLLELLTHLRGKKVAYSMVKDLAKRAGGREALYDMFMDRPKILARRFEVKMISDPAKQVEELRYRCALWVVEEEERIERERRAAIFIAKKSSRTSGSQVCAKEEDSCSEGCA